MSARSSSGSWSGAGGAPPDIIDLDKFMRGAVRPPRADLHAARCGDKLVVDAGGVDRKPGLLAVAPPATLAPLAPGAPRSAPSESGSSRAPPHAKRFSHDSGLSETSYARRKHRPHRRAGGSEVPAARTRTPGGGSSGSLRAFRTACERALLDQQAQIARVAQLCERLSERAPPACERSSERAPRRRSERSSDSSELSSSSRSTRDQRRKDKHRTEECKIYKIIMNKLDELNRVFAARARSPPPAVRAAPRPPSSGSVSMSDKLVATEPDCPLPCAQVRAGCTYNAGGSCGGRGSCGRGSCGGRSVRAGLRTVTHTCALDIAPSDALPRHNIATESVVMCESRVNGGDPRFGFDLDDPVHLYSQAKRLQAMSATTRRARSVDARLREYGEHSSRLQEYEQSSSRPNARARCERPREPSLCALCRGYWRALTNYLAAQIFCCPDAPA